MDESLPLPEDCRIPMWLAYAPCAVAYGMLTDTGDIPTQLVRESSFGPRSSIPRSVVSDTSNSTSAQVPPTGKRCLSRKLPTQ